MKVGDRVMIGNLRHGREALNGRCGVVHRVAESYGHLHGAVVQLDDIEGIRFFRTDEVTVLGPPPYCRACDFGGHTCPGCGADVPHGTIACAECNSRGMADGPIAMTVLADFMRLGQEHGVTGKLSMVDIEKLCAQHLSTQRCTLWGSTFEIISRKGRNEAIRWLTEQVATVLELRERATEDSG